GQEPAHPPVAESLSPHIAPAPKERQRVNVIAAEDMAAVEVGWPPIATPVQWVLWSGVARGCSLTQHLGEWVRSLQRETVGEAPLKRRLQRVVIRTQARIELGDRRIALKRTKQVRINPRIQPWIEIDSRGTSEIGRVAIEPDLAIGHARPDISGRRQELARQ